MIERNVSLMVSLHVRDIADPWTRNITVAFFDTSKNNISFEGLRIDNHANPTSVISDCSYVGYCRTFNLAYSISSANNQMVERIGGTSMAVELVIIQVPFKELHVVVDVGFLINKETLPFLVP